jgi:cytochrome b561
MTISPHNQSSNGETTGASQDNGRASRVNNPVGHVPVEVQVPAGEYSLLQRRLHWIVVALVTFQLVLGVSIGTMDRQAQNDASLRNLLIVHLITGTTIFGLMWKRLSLRRQLGAPPSPQGTPLDAAMLARTNHIGFYVLLLVLPVLGWLAYLSSGAAAVRWGAIHGALALTLVLAICAHLGGVIYHTYIRRDGLLQRMSG